ncbi:MAG: type II/IV secretion system protein, partial [Pirellulaceae bacterium]
MDAGEILLKQGLLDSEQLAELRERKAEGVALVDAAVTLGFVKEEPALRALASESGLEFVDLRDAEVDLSLLEGFP